MLRFFGLFLFFQLAMFVFELHPIGQQYVVIPFTELIAKISATLIHLFDPSVISRGIELWNADYSFGVSIEAGCNGVEASIVLFAAMLAFPSSIKAKIIGMSIGFLAIQAMNLTRIITLFYIGQWNQSFFEWAHLYIWQVLIMLDVLVVFLIWLRFLSPVKELKNET